MNTPTMKRNLAVTHQDKPGRVIHFQASPELAEKLKPFGNVEKLADVYSMRVDARYDFDEVLAYVESLA